jgi:hypothetical protein
VAATPPTGPLLIRPPRGAAQPEHGATSPASPTSGERTLTRPRRRAHEFRPPNHVRLLTSQLPLHAGGCDPDLKEEPEDAPNERDRH